MRRSLEVANYSSVRSATNIRVSSNVSGPLQTRAITPCTNDTLHSITSLTRR